MMLLPVASPLPDTVREALPLDRLAVPRVLVPRRKVTEPAGKVVPLTGWTEAVITVLPFVVMLAGLAETVVVVATAGAVTVTEVDALEPVKAELPL